MQFYALSSISSILVKSYNSAQDVGNFIVVPLRYSMDMSNQPTPPTCSIASRLGVVRTCERVIVRPDDEGAIFKVLTELLRDGPSKQEI